MYYELMFRGRAKNQALHTETTRAVSNNARNFDIVFTIEFKACNFFLIETWKLNADYNIFVLYTRAFLKKKYVSPLWIRVFRVIISDPELVYFRLNISIKNFQTKIFYTQLIEFNFI